MSKDRTIEELRAHILSLEQTASLGYLISAVVHEVNNPLSVMLIGADQLRHAGVRDPAVNRHLDALNQQSDRIITISQRLQEMGRRNLADRRPWDLRDLLRTFTALDDAVSQPTEATRVVLPAEPLPVEVSGPQLVQVLRYVASAVRRLAECPSAPLVVSATQQEIALILVGPAAARSPTRMFGVVQLQVGTPGGDPVAYKELVPDFFSEERPAHEVELMASWEVIRKLAGKMQVRATPPAGAEIKVMVPLSTRPGDGRR